MFGWVAIVFYLTAAAACARASAVVCRLPQHRGESAVWGLIAALFSGLAILRLSRGEALATEHLRTLVRLGGLYDHRWSMQAPVAALIIFVGAVGAAWLLALLARRRLQVSSMARWASAAATGMVFLVVVRVVSFHPIDRLLYGSRLHLNWILDIGGTLTVVGAALCAARRAFAARRRHLGITR